MKIIRPGHCYEMQNFENKDAPGQTIQFIEKRPARNDGVRCSECGNYMAGHATGSADICTCSMITVIDGTTNEEVLAVLIDRLNFLNAKFPCRENAIAITHIETALLWLNKRTSDRLARGVEGKHIK